MNSIAGFGDAASFGLSGFIRRHTPGGDGVDYGSAAYLAGAATGTAAVWTLTSGASAASGGASGASAAGTASTAMGRAIQSLKASISGGTGQWARTSAHAEAATGRAYRGATSIEEVFVNQESGQRLVRHVIVRGEEILHETFRTFAKFGGGS